MLKQQVEAVLFAVGKQMKLDEISKMVNGNADEVKKVLEQLQDEYSKRDSSLTITGMDDVWKMNVRENYLNLVRNIVIETDLNVQTMETLAYIAYSSPVLQSDVIHKRNVAAYDHIKELMDLGFIVRQKKGRTFVLKITEKFWDYFDIEKSKAHPMFNQFKQNETQIEQQEEQIVELEEERLKEQETLQKHIESKKATLPLGEKLDEVDGGGSPVDTEVEYEEMVKKLEEEEKLRRERRKLRLQKLASKSSSPAEKKIDKEIEKAKEIEEELEEVLEK